MAERVGDLRLIRIKIWNLPAGIVAQLVEHWNEGLGLNPSECEYCLFVPLSSFFSATLAMHWKVQFRKRFTQFNNVDTKRQKNKKNKITMSNIYIYSDITDVFGKSKFVCDASFFSEQRGSEIAMPAEERLVMSYLLPDDCSQCLLLQPSQLNIFKDRCHCMNCNKIIEILNREMSSPEAHIVIMSMFVFPYRGLLIELRPFQ